MNEEKIRFDSKNNRAHLWYRHSVTVNQSKCRPKSFSSGTVYCSNKNPCICNLLVRWSHCSINKEGPSWLWLYGSWFYNYLYNQCLSPLTLWVQIPLRWGVLDTTLCDTVCQWLATCRWFSPCPPVFSTNKTDRHDITEILLQVTLNTINLSLNIQGIS